MGYPSSLCVHAPTCGRAVALEHDGSLYSCDHFVFEENYLGTIQDHSLAEMLESPQQREFGKAKLADLPSALLRRMSCPESKEDCKRSAWFELAL